MRGGTERAARRGAGPSTGKRRVVKRVGLVGRTGSIKMLDKRHLRELQRETEARNPDT